MNMFCSIACDNSYSQVGNRGRRQCSLLGTCVQQTTDAAPARRDGKGTLRTETRGGGI